jgi:LmbE family N-acetylglucosaminyl deacetylase
MYRLFWAFPLVLAITFPAAADEPLRIICFGAHPDDCELKAGGVGAMWAAKGHKVKFVSVTNGDIGHWRESGPALARRRKDEVETADKMLGVETTILDIHDGELEPTLANRKTVTRLIREWKADIVMSHRPNDYHPDHRYTGVLVQDAAFMVAVPKFLPEVAPLKRNPVFLYYSDRFQKPNSFEADVAVSIDAVAAKKVAALERMVSQFYEGGAVGGPQLVPDDSEGKAKREADVRAQLTGRDRNTAKQSRDKLIELYGKDAGSKVEFAEAFEVCEYGRQPDAAELRKLFPFFDK